MEELYKNELQILKDFADKEQYVSLSKIMEVFQNPSEELLDDIVKYLENEGIEITRESEELPDDELLVEKVDDDFDGFGDEIEIDEELQELASVVESEIFNILADNMSVIAPTGNSREYDFNCWLEAVKDSLQREERQIILIKDKENNNK